MITKDHFGDDFKCEHFLKGEPCPVLSEHACIADVPLAKKAADTLKFVDGLVGKDNSFDESIVLATALMSKLSSAPFPIRAGFARRVVNVLTRNTDEGLAPLDYRFTKGKEEEERNEILAYMKSVKMDGIPSDRVNDLKKTHVCKTEGCPGFVVWWPTPRNYWLCPVCASVFGSNIEPGDKDEKLHE